MRPSFRESRYAAGLRHRDPCVAARQTDAAHPSPVERRAGARGAVAALRHLPHQAESVLPARRGRCAARRREHWPLRAHAHAVQVADAVHRHHPQTAPDYRSGRRGLRRDDAGARRVLAGERPYARRSRGRRRLGRRGASYRMIRRRRVAALLGTVGVVAAGAAGSVEAQTIRLLLAGDSIPAAPPLVVTTSGVGADAGPVTIQIEISTAAGVQSSLYFALKAGRGATFFLL